jgi:formylglycine-generating enzyme required for sulfatase activity
MEFALVPKGKAWLGGGGGKPGTKDVEFKQDFYLGAYEVTRKHREQIMETNPSIFKGDNTTTPESLKQFPVENVSWVECQEFVRRVNERTKELGWVYRLPKVEEREYACRGGPMANRDESAFDFYFEKPSIEMRPEDGNFKTAVSSKLNKVGSYPPNTLALYDTHGNVYERCEDGNAEGSNWVVGGSYTVPTSLSRATTRINNTKESHAHDIGLRLARVPVNSEAPATLPKP